MRNIKLIIEYDGTAYRGWQIQKNGPTVQAMLKRAVERMVCGPVNLIGASRTDAGVHALGQVANFKTDSKIPCEGFLRGLNSLLPDDISICGAEDVPLSFHAKKDALAKHYRYLLMTGKTRPALMRKRVWFNWIPASKTVAKEQIPSPLCGRGLGRGGTLMAAKRLHKTAQTLVGTHDFSSFCASGDCNRSKVRKIESITVAAVSATIISVDIIGGGFLKQMVRNIVGTLVQTADSPSKMRQILAGRDRKKAGVTAPACGLYLVSVRY